MLDFITLTRGSDAVEFSQRSIHDLSNHFSPIYDPGISLLLWRVGLETKRCQHDVIRVHADWGGHSAMDHYWVQSIV